MDILSSQEINVCSSSFILIIIGTIALIVGIFTIVDGIEGKDWRILFGVIAIILGLTTISKSFYIEETYTEYKAIIHESANFHAVMDEYEILSQEGKIYTVRKKDNNK